MNYASLLIHANPSGQLKVKYLRTNAYIPVTFGGILTFFFLAVKENAFCERKKLKRLLTLIP